MKRHWAQKDGGNHVIQLQYAKNIWIFQDKDNECKDTKVALEVNNNEYWPTNAILPHGSVPPLYRRGFGYSPGYQHEIVVNVKGETNLSYRAYIKIDFGPGP